MNGSSYGASNLASVVLTAGKGEAEWTPNEEWGNPVGNVAGGYVAGVVDVFAGMTLFTVIERGAPTVTLQVDYLNAMPVGNSYVVRGEVIRVGKATAIVDVYLNDGDGLLVARGKCVFQLPSSWRDRTGPDTAGRFTG